MSSCSLELGFFKSYQPISSFQDTLQKIGISISVIETGGDVGHPQEEEIRQATADVLSELGGKKQNSLRVAGIPGVMESMSSLLHTGRSSNDTADEFCQRHVVLDHENYEFSAFSHFGLCILKKLAGDHDNCGKIGSTRGVLPKIIEFHTCYERWLRDEHIPDSQIKTVKLSPQVMKRLASTTGDTGKLLWREMSEIFRS
uniref:Uncharacterized protein n=1 Tax=Nelumbo nucifera TaxID=4432 RepID=A0A822YQT5_NELNU|nr:TPA_asm: hypothetical protein HUJ06_005517 [Nelumbo nucifera]